MPSHNNLYQSADSALMQQLEDTRDPRSAIWVIEAYENGTFLYARIILAQDGSLVVLQNPRRPLPLTAIGPFSESQLTAFDKMIDTQTSVFQDWIPLLLCLACCYVIESKALAPKMSIPVLYLINLSSLTRKFWSSLGMYSIVLLLWISRTAPRLIPSMGFSTYFTWWSINSLRKLTYHFP